MTQEVNRERKLIPRTQGTVYLDGMTLTEAIEHLTELAAFHGGDARISEHTEQYDEYDRLHIMVDVPESDHQMASRIALEEHYAAQHEARERMEFERLAAKFKVQG